MNKGGHRRASLEVTMKQHVTHQRWRLVWNSSLGANVQYCTCGAWQVVYGSGSTGPWVQP